jgi:hypothetical protein
LAVTRQQPLQIDELLNEMITHQTLLSETNKDASSSP